MLKTRLAKATIAVSLALGAGLTAPAANAYYDGDHSRSFASYKQCDDFLVNAKINGVCLQWKDTSTYVLVKPGDTGGGGFGGGGGDFGF